MSFSEYQYCYEFLSEYIYNEVEILSEIDPLNYEQLFDILDRILNTNNSITFGTVTMTIKKAFEMHQDFFIQKYANSEFFEFIMTSLKTTQLASVQRNCLLVLNAFTVVFSESKEVEFNFVIDLAFISSLLEKESTCYITLKYIHSIIDHFPFLLTESNQQFDPTPLFQMILEIAENNACFKARNEAFLVIMNGISTEILNSDFLKEIYVRIIGLFGEFIENNISIANILIEMMLKLCSFLIASEIDADTIQCAFNENDVEQILLRVNENSDINLNDEIQALFRMLNIEM